MLAELLTLRIGGGLSKERFGVPSLFPKRSFFTTPLYRALQAGFGRWSRSFANVEFGANVGERQGNCRQIMKTIRITWDKIPDCHWKSPSHILYFSIKTSPLKIILKVYLIV
jgi:hypothetical protein